MTEADVWRGARRLTPARVGLGRVEVEGGQLVATEGCDGLIVQIAELQR